MSRHNILRPGFSLVELVIVVTIVAIVASIAAPRMSRAMTASAEASLIDSLGTMRRAIEMYSAEHGGLLPLEETDFVEQMTKYTNISGDVSDTKTAEYNLGPYLKAIPPLPLGSNEGDATIAGGSKPGDKKDGGWWYNENTGDIRANLKDDEVDDSGARYNLY